jgi:hypothetical protein
MPGIGKFPVVIRGPNMVQTVDENRVGPNYDPWIIRQIANISWYMPRYRTCSDTKSEGIRLRSRRIRSRSIGISEISVIDSDIGSLRGAAL